MTIKEHLIAARLRWARFVHWATANHEAAYDEGYQSGHDEGFQEGLSVAKSDGGRLWRYLHEWLDKRERLEVGEEYSIHDLMDLLHEYERDLKDIPAIAAQEPSHAG